MESGADRQAARGGPYLYNFQGVSVLSTEGVFYRVVEGGWVRRGDEVARLI